ncbi:MAG: hypothetical protein QOJ40_2694 [Verrucomicrobiota bacterium]
MRSPNDITSFTKVHKPLEAIAQKPHIHTPYPAPFHVSRFTLPISHFTLRTPLLLM